MGQIGNNQICHNQAVVKNSDMGCMGQKKKSDLGHICLQCERSLSVVQLLWKKVADFFCLFALARQKRQEHFRWTLGTLLLNSIYFFIVSNFCRVLDC